MSFVEIETTVLNNFPIIARCSTSPPEPDIGWPGDFQVEELLTIRGKPADFIERQMRAADWVALYARLGVVVNEDEFE